MLGACSQEPEGALARRQQTFPWLMLNASIFIWTSFCRSLASWSNGTWTWSLQMLEGAAQKRGKSPGLCHAVFLEATLLQSPSLLAVEVFSTGNLC